MSSSKAHGYAEKAREADKTQQWREAERYYLLAAQEIASSKVQEDVKNRKLWDVAAKRARRLQVLTK